MEIRLMSFKIK